MSVEVTEEGNTVLVEMDEELAARIIEIGVQFLVACALVGKDADSVLREMIEGSE
jgi:hypothetical protein